MTTRALGIVVALTGLAAVACGGVPVVARAEQVEGAFERTLQVTGAVSLDVLAGSGSIVVRAGSDGLIVVEGRIRARERRLFSRATLTPSEQSCGRREASVCDGHHHTSDLQSAAES